MSDMHREAFDHCQMSWDIIGMRKVFTCRQCGESVYSDHHPYRKCPAYKAAIRHLTEQNEQRDSHE